MPVHNAPPEKPHSHHKKTQWDNVPSAREYENRYAPQQPVMKEAPKAKKAEPYKKKEDEDEDLTGRRCIFHGEQAVMKCPNCGTLLCNECVRTGKCPRCGTQVGDGPVSGPVSDEDDELLL